MSESEKKEKKIEEKLSRVPSEKVEVWKDEIKSVEIQRLKEALIRSKEIEQKKAQAKSQSEEKEK